MKEDAPLFPQTIEALRHFRLGFDRYDPVNKQ